MRQIELETSSLTLSCGRQWLQVVLGLPDVHEGGWRLLFGQVLLPELLVPGATPGGYVHRITAEGGIPKDLPNIEKIGAKLSQMLHT